MPRTRWELPPHAQLEHMARLRQLAAMGVDVEMPEDSASTPEVEFEIGYAPSFHNIIFNASPSRIVLLTGARIVSRCSGIYFDENIEVTLPWNGPQFQLWYSDGVHEFPYRIVPGLRLDWNQVLNHQLEQGIRMQKRKVLTGMLLFVAYEAQLPVEYRHGTPIGIRVALIDSLGVEFPADGTVLVNRRLEPEKVVQRQGPRRSSLFDGPVHPSGADNSREPNSIPQRAPEHTNRKTGWSLDQS